jgi:hypothetical protein
MPPKITEKEINQLLVSIGLPEAKSIGFLKVSAGYHHLYLLTWDGDVLPGDAKPAHGRRADGTIEMILRISGSHLPGLKTENEIAIMRWLTHYIQIGHPAIPRFVPDIIRSDYTRNNPIDCEYILMEIVPGVTASSVYDDMTDADKRLMIKNLALIVTTIHQGDLNHIGGLSVHNEREGVWHVVSGPVIELTFWMNPDINRYWGPRESPSTLNVSGPFSCYSDYVIAVLAKLTYAIQRHNALASLCYLVPRLQALSDYARLPLNQEQLNETKYILAHKDLHLGNIMWDPVEKRISGILDWEFASFVPAFLWDPCKHCLWARGDLRSEKTQNERTALMKVFHEACEGYSDSFKAQIKQNLTQNSVRIILECVRELTRTLVKEQQLPDVKDWHDTIDFGLRKLGL